MLYLACPTRKEQEAMVVHSSHTTKPHTRPEIAIINGKKRERTRDREKEYDMI